MIHNPMNNYKKLYKVVVKELSEKLPSDLPYHGIAHTLDVIRATEFYARSASIDDAHIILLQTAALLHETGIMKGYTDHETASVRYALTALPLYGYSTAQIDQISQLILDTRFPQQPTNLLSMILCDADLDYLGRPDYFAISHKLRLEWINLNNYTESLKQWYQEQFLFLNEHQYFTPWANKHRNSGKEHNIRLIENLLKY